MSTADTMNTRFTWGDFLPPASPVENKLIMTTILFEKPTKSLIDSLKSICSTYDLGGDDNEFKIIMQVSKRDFHNGKLMRALEETSEVKQTVLKARF